MMSIISLHKFGLEQQWHNSVSSCCCCCGDFTLVTLKYYFFLWRKSRTVFPCSYEMPKLHIILHNWILLFVIMWFGLTGGLIHCVTLFVEYVVRQSCCAWDIKFSHYASEVFVYFLVFFPLKRYCFCFSMVLPW